MREIDIKKIDHIGIAVKDLDSAVSFYKDILGLPFIGSERVENLNIIVAFFQCGDVEIELVQGVSEEARVSKFIKNKGEGLYHIAFRVNNVEEALKGLKEKGYATSGEKPRSGINNTVIAFLNPDKTGGVLTELIEKPNITKE